MSDSKETSDKPASGSRATTMTLKRTVDTNQVRQSVTTARSKNMPPKTVVFETKKKRAAPAPQSGSLGRGAVAPIEPVVARPADKTPAAPAIAPVKKPVAPPPAGSSAGGRKAAGGLSEDERDARVRALNAAREREATERARLEEEARRRQLLEAEARKKAEEDRRRDEEEARRRKIEEKNSVRDEVEEAVVPSAAAEFAPIVGRSTRSEPAAKTDTQQRAEQLFGRGGPVIVQRQSARVEVAKPAAAEPAKVRADEARPRGPLLSRAKVEEEDEGNSRKVGPGGAVKRVKSERTPARRPDDPLFMRSGKVNLDQILSMEERHRSEAAAKRRRERERLRQLGPQQPREKVMREVVVPEAITIQDLSNRMAERGVDIIKYLMKQGNMLKITDVVDSDTAELIVREFGHTPRRVSEADVEEGFIGTEDQTVDMDPRAPIVTIMGHVDHGKTSLLDAIRETNVVSGEAGGITQHIGAYQVTAKDGQRITFIDTPGHEAFTAMRARGAKVTDIVVLVVAADDGVMPQTIEAINHAKSAGVPLIVAINKIDKPTADPNRVRTELLQHSIVVESMSGETLEVEVSALKKTNLDKLLEAIALQSELLELRANPKRSAEGVVIEAKLEAGRGPVGTVLIQRGTLHVGDIVVAGSAWGRVRALLDDHAAQVKEAGPSVPVEVLGFSSAPEAGDQLAVVENESRAREITDYRVRKRRERVSVGGGIGVGRTLEQMMQSLKGEGRKEFTLVVKGDVQGSVEAINAALEKLGTDEVSARIVHSGVGGITESDISLASASNSIIVGFNVRANSQARAAAERDGIEIRYYAIIYDLVDDVRKAMSGLLAPTQREIFLGNAQILEVFNISKVGKVAGCRITEGKVERGAEVRLIRDNVVIHRGKLSTLKRFKDEVKEVPAGQECGMAFEAYQDMRAGDIIECFRVEIVARSL